MPLFPSPCSSWCVASYDTLPAPVSSLERSLSLFVFGWPFCWCHLFDAHFFFPCPSVSLTHHVCASVGHTPCTCAYTIFPLKKFPWCTALPRPLCLQQPHLPQVFPSHLHQPIRFALLWLFLSISLSHTHTHCTHTLSLYLSLSLSVWGMFLSAGGLFLQWSLSPLLYYTGFLNVYFMIFQTIWQMLIFPQTIEWTIWFNIDYSK